MRPTEDVVPRVESQTVFPVLGSTLSDTTGSTGSCLSTGTPVLETCSWISVGTNYCTKVTTTVRNLHRFFLLRDPSVVLVTPVNVCTLYDPRETYLRSLTHLPHPPSPLSLYLEHTGLRQPLG